MFSSMPRASLNRLQTRAIIHTDFKFLHWPDSGAGRPSQSTNHSSFSLDLEVHWEVSERRGDAADAGALRCC